MSPAELARIRARTAAATPGPWGYLAPSGEVVAPDLSEVASCLHIPDGLWIAHARADVPALLAQLDQVELGAAALRQALEELTACACEVDGGLDCPACEPVPVAARRALGGTAGRPLVAELHAARGVVEAARDLDDEDLDLTDTLHRISDAVDGYDQAVGADDVAAGPAGSPGPGGGTAREERRRLRGRTR